MIHNFSIVVSRIACTSWILKATFGQTTAVILLIPEATASCQVITKHQISFVFATCVHQHNSMETISLEWLNTLTTRTTSPYLSSKNALAQSLTASS